MGLNRELDGFMVVSLEQAVAAPYCSTLLADAGARVIKVERPEGDFAREYDAGANGQSAIFAWLNRGKESIALNLKTPEDTALLRRILQNADVFLSNLAPGAIDRLELTGPRLRLDNSGLISCTITGYGETGDAAQKKAYDFLVQAEAGICAVTGTPDAPARVGVSLSDLATGLTAFSAILRALLQRIKTGNGVDLKISMFDVMADWMNMPLLAHRYMGEAPDRMGLKHSFIAPYGAFQCANGALILISVQNNREFTAFCEQVLEQPQLPKDPRFSKNTARYANRIALEAIVNTVFKGFSSAEMVQKLDVAKIANARLNSVAELSEHPFLKNSSAIIGGMPIDMAALPVATMGSTAKLVPNLNADGAALRHEFSLPSQPTLDIP